MELSYNIVIWVELMNKKCTSFYLNRRFLGVGNIGQNLPTCLAVSMVGGGSNII